MTTWDLASGTELVQKVLREVPGVEDPPEDGRGVDTSTDTLGCLFDTSLSADTGLLSEFVGAHILAETSEGRFGLAPILNADVVPAPRLSNSDEVRKAAVRRLAAHFLAQAAAAVDMTGEGDPADRQAKVDTSQVKIPTDPDQWLAQERLGVLAAIQWAAEEGCGDVVVALAGELWPLQHRAQRLGDLILVQTWARQVLVRTADVSVARVCARLAWAHNAFDDRGDASRHDSSVWATVALRWAEQSRGFAEASGNLIDKGTAEAMLSGAYARLGQRKEAEAAMTAALDLYHAGGARKRDIGMRLCERALMSAKAGRCDDAVADAVQAQRCMAWDGRQSEIAHAHLVHARVQYLCDRLLRAVDAARDALAAGPSPMDEASTRKLLGWCYLKDGKNGDTVQASVEWERAQELYERYGHRREAVSVEALRARMLGRQQ
jgi:tetratricopeptide (TPR) repeat protein